MNYFDWVQSRIRTFTVWDIGIFKICLFAFTLMVAKLWPVFLSLDWYWYGVVFAVTYAYVLYRMFISKIEKQSRSS